MLDRSLRLLTLGPDNESLQVRPYFQPMGEKWAAMLVADGATPPERRAERERWQQAAVRWRIVAGGLAVNPRIDATRGGYKCGGVNMN